VLARGRSGSLETHFWWVGSVGSSAQLLHGIFAFLYVAGIFSMMFDTVGNFL
jgi:hypothetical protein